MNYQNNPLLTVQEMADELKCSTSSIYRMVRKEIIPFYDVLSSYRFDREKVLEALRHRKLTK